MLFELLKRTRVFSEAHIRERLKSAHALLRSSLPEFVIRKRGERRTDVLLTYIDGEGKSGQSYASLYAEENGIVAECVTGLSGFRANFLRHVEKYGQIAALIVMDDIAATGSSLSENIAKLITEFGDLLKDVKVRVITLVATTIAQARILRDIQKGQDLDIDFMSCEILPEETYAFQTAKSVWRSEEEAARAKALCTNLGARTYKQNPLGYGGMGLLLVFPTTVPNNSLPILHSYARTGSGQGWKRTLSSRGELGQPRRMPPPLKRRPSTLTALIGLIVVKSAARNCERYNPIGTERDIAIARVSRVLGPGHFDRSEGKKRLRLSLRNPLKYALGHCQSKSCLLPARASGRARAPLFLLTNHRRARPDSTPKMAYTYLP